MKRGKYISVLVFLLVFFIISFLSILFILVKFDLDAQLAPGRIYYLDINNGNDNNDGLSPTTGWKTLSKANSILQAGDTLYLRKGIYRESIFPKNNGLVDSPITYKNYNGESVNVTGSGTSTAINLKNKQYVIVDGINVINPVETYAVLTGGKGNVIQNSIMNGVGQYDGVRLGTYGDPTTTETSYNIIRNNKIYGHPILLSTLALETIPLFFNAHHNIIENNYIENADHTVIYVKGNGDGPTRDAGTENPHHNIIRNNTLYNPMHQVISEGYGAHNNLYENNFIMESGSDAEGFHLGYVNAIIRNNKVIKSGSVDMSSLEGALGFNSQVLRGSLYRSANNRVYNNLISFNRGIGIGNAMGVVDPECYEYPITFTGNNSFINNIIVDNANTIDSTTNYQDVEIAYLSWKSSTCKTLNSNIAPITGDVYKNNIIGLDPTKKIIKINFGSSLNTKFTLLEAEKLSNPLFVNNLQGDPSFVNVQANNFALKEGSIAIDAGASLASALNSGSNSINLKVSDSSYFIDGWGITNGDLIKVGANSIVRIKSIDYSTNMLTLEVPISWAINDKVSLAYQGNAPDIGPIEFGQVIQQSVCVDFDNDGYNVTLNNCGIIFDCDDTNPSIYQNCTLESRIIIDNLDQGFSSIGNWPISGGSGQYGLNSIYSRTPGDSSTWMLNLPPAIYSVYAWWTYFPSRANDAPYSIYSGNNLLQTVRVNQNDSSLGGKWNLLGGFEFNESAKLILKVEDSRSYNADAVSFIKTGDINVSCTKQVFYPDNDGDTYGAGSPVESCTPLEGYVLNNIDCDDNNNTINFLKTCSFNGDVCGNYQICGQSCPLPPAEICGNNIDENCNGAIEQCSLATPILKVANPRSGKTYKNILVPIEFNATSASNCWYVLNSIRKDTSCIFKTSIKLSTGKYNIDIKANNSAGITEERRSFSTITSRKFMVNGNRYIESGSLGELGDYTDEELGSITSFKITLPDVGSIEFLEEVNLLQDANKITNIIDLDSNLRIDPNIAEVDTTVLSSLNKKARITLEGLSFEKPRILKNGIHCQPLDCIIESYSNGKLVFTVSQFSAYTAEETPSEQKSEETPISEIDYTPTFQKIMINNEVSYFEIRNGEEILLALNDKEHIAKLNIDQEKIRLRIIGNDYTLSKSKPLSLNIDGTIVYIGLTEIYSNVAVLAVSLNKNSIIGEIKEDIFSKKVYLKYILMTVLIIVLFIVLLIVWSIVSILKGNNSQKINIKRAKEKRILIKR